jgi:succinate dehydrogenase hydrophobic anchor subunit
MVFEFPRDNDIKTRARVDPIKLKNKADPEVKMRFALDIVNLLVQVVLGVFRLIFAYKSNPGEAIKVFILNIAILVLVAFTHLYYFNFYENREYELDDFKYFREIYKNQATSKRLMISSYLLHGW